MVGNSKVLTVSYGTFSCTLEGFDDSFDTMKAIAEYFRDLAAEDRYFGAEPPQPDAEVLARIAERELSRGVKARAEGNTVLLQPSAAPAPAVEEAAPVETDAGVSVEAQDAAAEAEVAAKHVEAVEAADARVEEDATAVAAEEASDEVAEAADVFVEEVPAPENRDEGAAADIALTGAAAAGLSAMAAFTANDEEVEAEAAEDDAIEAFASDVAPVEAELVETEETPAELEAIAEDTVEEDVDELAEPAPEMAEDSAAEAAPELLEDAVADDAMAEDAVSIEAAMDAEEAADDVVEDAVAEDAGSVEAVADAEDPVTDVADDVEMDEAFAEDADRVEAVSDAEDKVADVVADMADDPETDDAAAEDEENVEAVAELADDADYDVQFDEHVGSVADEDEVDFDAVAKTEDADEVDFEDAAEEDADAASDFDSIAADDVDAPFAEEAEVEAQSEDAPDAEAPVDAEADSEAADVTEADEKPAMGVVDSLAAKLRRIQAVVGASRSASGRDANSAYTEDEHAEDFSEGAVDASDEEDTTIGGDEDEAAPRVLRMKRADFEKAIAMASGTALRGEDADVAGASDDETDDIAEEAAVSNAAGTAGVADAADEPQESPEVARGTSLSAEDEADLMAELAAAEAEAAAESDIDDVASLEAEAMSDALEDETAVELSDEAIDQDTGDDEVAEAADVEDQETTMSRLMDEAEAKLGEPEARTRRDAYSHLKAAVAAKQAAQSMGEEYGASAEEREDEYRADLAEVVRPRRAEKSADGKRTSRPSTSPLKLVASQRVDAPQADAEGPALPVRPRRVAADAAEPAGAGFADFAKSAGAEELSDTLEAAAAFITHVEGHAVFSRPQMMRVVQQAMPQGSFTREDGLRAFGTLLRQGRINKTRGGQFEVTESTRFQPEARETRAAG